MAESISAQPFPARTLEVGDGSSTLRSLDLDDPSLYLNRELSWLDFNRRVLALARRNDVPLVERLKFVAIASRNLDEFFMVRIGGLERSVAQARRDREAWVSVLDAARGPDGMGALEILNRAYEEARALSYGISTTFLDHVLPLLEAERLVRLVAPAAAGGEAYAYYQREVHPCLTPIAIDPAHPFPLLRSGTLNVAFRLSLGSASPPASGSSDEHRSRWAVVQVPSMLPRFRAFPGDRCPQFVAMEDLIACFASELFPGHRVVEAASFRVTRASDLDIAEDEVDDLLSSIEDELRRRERGQPVRLELSEHTSAEMAETLRDAIGLEDRQLVRNPGPVKLGDLWDVIRGLDAPEHRDEPFQPAPAARLGYAPTIFRSIEEGDVLLHHPYESFRPVVDFIEQAASDPDVMAIKMTLYRTSGDSPLVRALTRAAEAGKEVTALVELKARFDEANNIAWAKELEQSGVHVVYGLIGLKTHCKMLLVIRREGARLARYVHLSTGNYNPSTARLYTDLGLFTAHEGITRDALLLFNVLTGYSELPEMNHLGVAPFGMRQHILDRIGVEIQHARAGRPSGIVAQMNSLVDGAIIKALYEASRAGVPIRLVVRGICCLRPEVPGVSENIQVISVLDRFLEHSRITWWRNGGDDLIYASSADWMPRNLDRRIEVVFPLLDPEVKARVIEDILEPLLRDNTSSWRLGRDAVYRPNAVRGVPYRAQEAQIEKYQTQQGRLRHLRPEVPAKRLLSPAARVAEAQQRRLVAGRLETPDGNAAS
ncbi:MAG: polyphosphate kinase 1 [Myxococcota bacterium]